MRCRLTHAIQHDSHALPFNTTDVKSPNLSPNLTPKYTINEPSSCFQCLSSYLAFSTHTHTHTHRPAIIFMWFLQTHTSSFHHHLVNSKQLSWLEVVKFTHPQTTILEGWTNLSECVSWEVLFKGVSTRFGLGIVEKCFQGNASGTVGEDFQNLRPPKRRFWKVGPSHTTRTIISECVFDARLSVL